MTDRIDRKLEELGLTLPQAAAPVASYVPAVEANGLLHIAGQLPFKDGQIVTGRLGDGVSLEDGQDAAQRCALMLVAQMKAGREDGLAKLVALTPPEVVEALRPRAQALADQQLTLVGERMRIASGRPRR